MAKDTNVEGLSRQKPFDGTEHQPDDKGEKVLHSKANKTPNNKPKSQK